MELEVEIVTTKTIRLYLFDEDAITAIRALRLYVGSWISDDDTLRINTNALLDRIERAMKAQQLRID